METNLQELTVDAFTSPFPVSVTADTGVDEVMDLMEQHNIRHIPVVENGNKPIGILTQRDLRMVQHLELAAKYQARDLMVDDPYTVQTGSSLENVAFELSKQKIGSALILDKDQNLQGIFTSTDALNALIEIVRGEVLTDN